MNRRPDLRRRSLVPPLRSAPIAAVLLLLLACTSCTSPSPTAPVPSPSPEASPSPTAAPVSYLQSATVQILAQTDLPSGPETIWFGSGTVITPDGLVLTNAHVAEPQLPELAAMQRDLSLMHTPEADRLVVAVVVDENLPPEPRYLAETVVADGIVDLAVLRLVSDLDGEQIEPGALELPYARLGDSDSVHLGDQLNVLGFPGAGGETITLTRGSVSGFVRQSLVGDRAWMKTDSSISSGASGGMGSDDEGRLIGIPTLASNMPSGINLLRPANFARPLIEAAKDDQPYESPYAVAGTGREALTLVAWAESVDENGCALAPVEAYDEGAIGLAAVFRYRGMSDGQLMLADWSYADAPLNSAVWFWDGGEKGACFPLTFHDFGRPLDSGQYAVRVRAAPELEVVGEAATDVGIESTKPAESTAAARGAVLVEGTITDAATGQPIANAVLLVLKPGVSVAKWNGGGGRGLDDVFTVAETGADGRYQLSRRLERSARYEVAADHPEYLLKEGVFEFDYSVPDVHTVNIELSR